MLIAGALTVAGVAGLFVWWITRKEDTTIASDEDLDETDGQAVNG